MAKAYIEDAGYSLKEAKTAFKGGLHHRAVRRAQECVEFSLKAILRLLGVEYPRQHEVSAVLEEAARRKGLPEWFLSALPEVSLISRRLAEERGPAFYGEERAFTPPRSLYREDDAEKAVTDAEKVLGLCRKLLQELGSSVGKELISGPEWFGEEGERGRRQERCGRVEPS